MSVSPALRTHGTGRVWKSPGARGLLSLEKGANTKAWIQHHCLELAPWVPLGLQTPPGLLQLPPHVHQPRAIPVGSQGTWAETAPCSVPAACHPSVASRGHLGCPVAQHSHCCWQSQAQTWCKLLQA